MKQTNPQIKNILLDKLIKLIGTEVDVFIDRPLGSHHPTYQDMMYPVNYGYINDIIALDGEYQDAYVLGVDKPLKSFKGIVIGIINRTNDNEDKLIVASNDSEFTNAEIEKEVSFQEKYFKYNIIR